MNTTGSVVQTPLSAVIITLNEERNIGRCITSLLPVADEVVVVDSGSGDRTVEIALALGAKVLYNKFEGHIEQKNFALKQAVHPLVLSLDADEALSEELATSVMHVKLHPDADCYRMNRLTNYCGKWIRHGGWYPDTKLRLIRKGAAQWGGTNPHDELKPITNQLSAKLKGDLLHYSIISVSHHVKQIDYFTTIAAKQLSGTQASILVIKIIASPLISFFRDYFLKFGFLDGIHGFAIATLSAFYTFLKYLKVLLGYHE